ncbi:MAG: phosphatase PAP2 family protein [Ignavibacteriae bacterium]|nr:phosphatase PAP2 family protein [Ignavibacteriota bacterium]
MRYRIFNILALLFILNISLFAQRRDLIPPDPDNADVKIFRSINNLQCGLLNTVIPVTDKSILFTSTLVPAGLFAYSRSQKNYYDENTAVLTALSEGLSAGITFGLKNIFKRDRPFKTLSNVHYDKSRFLLDRYSFPSGHSAISFSMATSLTLRYPDEPVLISVVYFYSTVIALGRIYLGVHYPSDVLAGMLIGSGSAAIVYSLRKEIIKGKNSLFREDGREDINQKSISTGLILTSFIISDAVNYFTDKINLKRNINVEFNGFENRIDISVGF